MHRRAFLALSSAFAAAPVLAKRPDKWSRDFGAYVADTLALTHTPGMSVAAVRGGRTVFSAGYGYADVERARRVTPDTIFQIASVSKTVTATALMLLEQGGAFRLDDPIAPRLDFPVVHPKFPDVPITFRHLFTHTSGISDAIYDDMDFSAAPVPPLRDFLARYLASEKGYTDARPGTAWRYSNVGAALLGHLAGRMSPDPLDTITRERLFAPLGLRNTSWRYEGVDDAHLAYGYDFTDARYHRLPRNAYPDWPAGLLCTSANDFARFLSLYAQGGGGILKPETVAAMFTPDPVVVNPKSPMLRQGLIWELTPFGGGTVAMHPGGDPGTSTLAVADAAEGIAALSFANVTPNKAVMSFQKEAVRRLLERARAA
jgi:CubicO group peptidase (beta-lactamase class C family)